MSYTYEYDLAYLPAMPIVTIQIGRPDVAPSLTLPALVDSGADATMIPIRHLKQVNAIKRQQVFIRSVSGRRVGAYLYNLPITNGNGSMWSAIKILTKLSSGATF